jgi:hypothetical protein
MFPDIAPSSRTPGQAYTRNLVVAQERIDVVFGDPQINVPHPFQQYKITYNSDVLSGADLDALRDHFALNAATYFSFFCFWGSQGPTDTDLTHKRSIPKIKAADVVLNQLVYTLPAKAVDTPVLYDGTGAVISNTRYVINAGAGSEGADNVTFNSLAVQPAGPTLSFSANGGRRRFAAFYEWPQEFPEAYEEGDVWTLGSPLRLITSVTLT